jgi:hypothetical protein
MNPELEKLESAFNTKIEAWISKQGLLFQFAHNTGAGSIYPKIYGLFVRIIILGLIALAIFWFYLSSRPDSIDFKEDVQRQLQAGLNATDLKISNITRDKGGLLTGKLLIASLSMGETETSFFEDWFVTEEQVSAVGRRSLVEKKNTASLEGIHLSPLGIGDNYLSGWSGKELQISKMEMKVKTGAETDQSALDAYLSLFKEYESLKIDNIQVFDANLLWGYSELTSGSIKGAQLNILRGQDSWEVNVTGGMFSHGWLHDAEIKQMKVICKRSGEVVIESATFIIGDGELELKASIKVQAQPVLAGSYAFKNVDVIDLIGAQYEDLFDGEIDGQGELSGMLNSEAGIKSITTIDLRGSPQRATLDFTKSETKEEKKDSILIIRGDNFQFLKTMQINDPRNSYSLLRAHSGRLIIENQGTYTQIEVNDLRCGFNDLILIRGKFDFALRQVEEKIEKADASSSEEREIKSNSVEEAADSEEISTKMLTLRVFSGELNMGIIPEAFENKDKILNAYPVDNETLRVWFTVNMSGQLEELTNELADELYMIMQEDENN